MSEVAKQIEIENEANEDQANVTKTANVPAPAKKEWKCQYGRTIGRNPRERQGWQTNADYANSQDHFKTACEAAGIPATARQASKFRNKKGQAYEAHRKSLNAA
jgi:hypothetical protein